MTDTARVLLTAAALSGVAVTTFAWRLLRTDANTPARLVGELRLAQWASILLAGVGAVPVGLAVMAPTAATAGIDAALGVVVVGVAGLIFQR